MNREEISRKLVGKTTRFLKKNSSVILMVCALVGLGATVYTVSKAVPKAQKAIKEAEEEKGEPLTRMETVKAVAPDCIVPAAICIATAGCIIAETVIDIRKEKALTAAVGLVQSGFNNYRNALIELHGEEADREVIAHMARTDCEFHQIGLDSPDEKVIWYDELSGKSVEAYEREIMDAEYHFNRNFVMRGYASLEELYIFLGIDPPKGSDKLGWTSSDGYMWVDFQHRLLTSTDDPGTPIYSIDFVFAPSADYLSEWEWPGCYDNEDADDDSDIPWDTSLGISNKSKGD